MNTVILVPAEIIGKEIILILTYFITLFYS